MKKKFLNAIFLSALALGTVGTISSCKDYDDEISELNSTVASLKSELSSQGTSLQGALQTAQSNSAAAQTAADNAAKAVKEAQAAAEAAQATADAAVTKEALDAAVKELTAKLDELAAANAEVATLEEAIAKVEKTLAGLESGKVDQEEYKAKVAELKKAIEAIDTESLDKRLKQLEAFQKVVEEYKLGDWKADIDKKIADAIAEAKKGNTEAINALRAELGLQLGALRSLVFVPDAFLEGVPAAKAYYYSFTRYGAIKAADINADQSTDAPVFDGSPNKDVKSTVPFSVDYQLNPNNVNTSYITDVIFATKDVVNITRANGKAAPKLTAESKTFSNGVMTVITKLEGYDGIATTNGEITMFNAQVNYQVPVKEGEEAQDEFISSDYAAIYADMRAIDAVLFDAKPVKTALAEKASTAVVIAQIPYDNQGTDLSKLVTTGYNTTKFFTPAELDEFGMKYTFELIGDEAGDGKGNSAFGTISGNTFRPQFATFNTITKKWASDGKQDFKSVGKTPLVRVFLADKDGNKAAVGYFKLEIVDMTIPQTPIKFTVTTPFTVASDVPEMKKEITWGDLEAQLKEFGITGRDFNDRWKFGNVYDKMTPPNQNVKSDVDDGTYSERNALTWTVAPNEAYETFLELQKAKKATQISRFIEYTNIVPGSPSIWVEITWTSEVNIAPSGAISDDSKLKSYWFAKNSIAQGTAEIHMSPVLVGAKFTGAVTEFTKDISSSGFVGGAPSVTYNAPYDAKKLGAAESYVFATPDVTTVYGLDNATNVVTKYTLRAGNPLLGTGEVATDLLIFDEKNVLKGTLATISGKEIVYSDNDIAKAILNQVRPSDIANVVTAKVQIGVSTTLLTAKIGRELPVAVTNNTFDVKFLRSINIGETTGIEFTAGINGEEAIKLSMTDLTGAILSPDVPVTGNAAAIAAANAENTKRAAVFAKYGITNIEAITAQITTDVNDGDLDDTKNALFANLIKDATVKYTAPATPAYNDFGKIEFADNGLKVSAAFKVRIPLKITYAWGTMKVGVDITIKPSVVQ
jgi:hypothetical protein